MESIIGVIYTTFIVVIWYVYLQQKQPILIGSIEFKSDGIEKIHLAGFVNAFIILAYLFSKIGWFILTFTLLGLDVLIQHIS